MALDVRSRIKATAGQSSPRDEFNPAATFSGTATVALVDRGGGDYAWQFGGAGISNLPIGLGTRDTATSGQDFWDAYTVKMVQYPATGFTPLFGIGPVAADSAAIGNDCFHVSQSTSSSLRSRIRAMLAQTLSATAFNEITFVRHLRVNAAGSAEHISIWRSDSTSTLDAADLTTSSSQIVTAINLAAINFNTASATGANAIYQIKDYVVGFGIPSDADARALAKNLRGFLDGAATLNPLPAGMLQENFISSPAVVITPAGAGTLNPSPANLLQANAISSAAATITPQVVGTVTSGQHLGYNNLPIANYTVARTTVTRMDDGVQVVNSAGLVTNNEGRLVVTDAAIVPGVDYMIADWDATGNLKGISKVTAA